jgi:signal transduction histidine kinase
MAFGKWPAPVAGAAALSWLHLGLLGLALAGPIGLVGFVVVVMRREGAMVTEAQRRTTQRRRALLDLLDLLPVPVAVSGARDARAAPNRALAHLLHVERGAAADCALDWQQVVVAEDWPAWVGSTDSARRTGRAQWLRCTMQVAGARSEVLAQIAPIDGEDGVEITVSLTLPQAEGGLAQETILQLRDLLEVAEGEKWRFGQAVHDELGQRLSGIAYFAKALQRKLQKEQRIEAEDAGWLTSLANESMSVARGLARGLVPVGTDDPAALAAALADLCANAGRTFGIRCSLHVDPRFDAGGAAQANHLYHATQELVTNAIKHGGARHVQVSLEVQAGQQRVTVHNDGTALSRSPARTGMGVNGVRGRVAYLGGRFTLADQSEGGVLASIELPVLPDSTEAPPGPPGPPGPLGVGTDPAASDHGDRP